VTSTHSLLLLSLTPTLTTQHHHQQQQQHQQPESDSTSPSTSAAAADPLAEDEKPPGDPSVENGHVGEAGVMVNGDPRLPGAVPSYPATPLMPPGPIQYHPVAPYACTTFHPYAYDPHQQQQQQQYQAPYIDPRLYGAYAQMGVRDAAGVWHEHRRPATTNRLLTPEQERERAERRANSLDQRNGARPDTAPLRIKEHLLYPDYDDKGRKQLDKHYEFFRTGNQLGKGSFGSVEVVRHRATGRWRACKTIAIGAPEEFELVKTEIELLKKLDHPNIMRMYETYHVGCTVFLIIELCEGGPLFDKIVEYHQHKRQFITEQQVQQWMRQILSATSYCHQRRICHRDLKPENILFRTKDENSDLKVIDFGLSSTLSRIQMSAKEVKEVRKGTLGTLARLLPTLPSGKHLIPWHVRRVKMQRAGTPHYMSPEMIRGQYDEKCDCFSIGIIFYQLLSGKHPFYNPGIDNEETVKARILNEEPLMTPDALGSVSLQAKDLLKRLLDKNHRRRISACQALSHDWFRLSANHVHLSKLTPSVFEGLRDYQHHNKIKQAVLNYLAKELDERVIEDLRKKFKALDKGGDGTISLEDVKTGMRLVGYPLPPSSELSRIFESFDPTGSNRIGYNDFLSALLAKRIKYEDAVREQQLRAAFERLDVHKEGRISAAALREALTSKGMGSHLTEEQVQQCIDEIDKNRDGYIDWDEFYACMLTYL